MHDLGGFPNALGYPQGNDEMMPVEECGNMLIMTLAYAQKANDKAYLAKHYAKLQQWTGYLVNDSLIPANQLSTDDFAGQLANQTNLALKGIIGIAAMGQMAKLTGNPDPTQPRPSRTSRSGTASASTRPPRRRTRSSTTTTRPRGACCTTCTATSC